MKSPPHFAAAALCFIAFTLSPAGAQGPGATPRPAPPGAGARVQTLDELLAALDKDHDGRISKEEATGQYRQRFSQWDANGDGFATRQEIHDFRLSRGLGDDGQRVAANNPSGAGKGRTRTATILQEPADWRLENLPIPPTFATDIKLTGTEEIRFAPGMFDNTSSSYFTCVIAIAANDAPPFGEAEIKDFLEKYYRGLSLSRGKRAGLSPDPAEMRAVVTPAPPGADANKHYLADVTFFDSFSDGRKILLHVEAQVIPRPDSKKTYLLLLVSPSPKESAEWKTLREIERKSAGNVP